jgi:dihydroorotase-like cyclic amidohydrolase
MKTYPCRVLLKPCRNVRRPFSASNKAAWQPGAPADFVIVDPQLSWTVEDSALRSRSKNSPYEHRTLEGHAVETVVAGRTVYEYAV